jgi:protein subunit release factor A
MENLSLNDTPPGQPLHQSTPENTGARPKLRPKMEAANQFPETDEFYHPFGPHDLYQARLQQIHRQYQEQFTEAHQEKERSILRKQLYQNLEDAETSFKLLLKNPEMMTMTPEQLQQALAKPPNTPEQKKKGLLKKLLTPKSDIDKPRTRFQMRQQKGGETTKTVKK